MMMKREKKTPKLNEKRDDIMILNNEIIEYDIEHAGPSILYNAKAISKELYEELKNKRRY